MENFKYVIALILFFASSLTYSQSEIIPLEVGNYWKFENKEGDVEYIRVMEQLIINEEKWFRYREMSDDDIFIVKNTSEGQVELDPESKQTILVFKYPVSKETTYYQFGNKTLVSPSQKVTVPAGTFEAYLYNFSVGDPVKTILMWVAPGVGPIKSTLNDEVFELVEYNIK